MTTGVGLGRTCLASTASFNSATPKTPCWTQRSPKYLLHKPSYSLSCLKFRCHGCIFAYVGAKTPGQIDP